MKKYVHMRTSHLGIFIFYESRNVSCFSFDDPGPGLGLWLCRIEFSIAVNLVLKLDRMVYGVTGKQVLGTRLTTSDPFCLFASNMQCKF